MDTDKIINDIINQTSVNDMKNELINLKGYLNSLDAKISALNFENERTQKEYEDNLDKISLLKKEIFDDCLKKYEKELSKLNIIKKDKFQKLTEIVIEYDKSIKKIFSKSEGSDEILKKQDNAEVEYEESVNKVLIYKLNYEKEIKTFNSVINYYEYDDDRSHPFNRINNNKFEKFKNSIYFDSNLLDRLMELLEKDDSIRVKWNNISFDLTLAEKEKAEKIIEIEELENRVNLLLEERKEYVKTIQETVDKTADVVEKGVKETVKAGKFAYNFVKDKFVSNISEEYNNSEKETSPKFENKEDKDFRDKVIDNAIDGAIIEGKKRLKSFFKDLKNNK